MALPKVKDVFSKGFVGIREDETLSKCLSLFKEKMPPVLVVLNSKGKYRGVIARRWIVRSRLDPSKTKVRKLMRSAPTVAPHDSLSEAARLMIESEVRQLPVHEGEKLVGVVTDEDVIHGAIVKEWGNARADEIMTENPFVVEENESVGAVLSLFREQGISHVPVVLDGRLVGIVSVHDIIEHIFQPRKRQTLGEIVGEKVPVLSIPVKGIMSKPVVTVEPKATLKDVEKKMHDFDVSSIVVARRVRPMGIVTKRDFLEPIIHIDGMGRRIGVQFAVKDVDVDEVQRDFVLADFDSFVHRFGDSLGTGTLFVYLKSHGSNFKGSPLVHCRLQLRTVRGSYFSSGEGWGIEATFRLALDRLERRILKSREFEHDPEFARKFLRRVRFPLGQL